jgi:hypothetical protein
MRGACSANGGEEKSIHGLVRKPKGNRPHGRPTQSIWLRIGIADGQMRVR